MGSFSRVKEAVISRETRNRHFKESVAGLDAFQRHNKFVRDYLAFYGDQGGSVSAASRQAPATDHDVLRESFRFIRTEEDDAQGTWEQRLAKRYYNKLFKEYCLADLSRYKESKIGLRWRTEKEVLAGKGQFICGAKGCQEQAGLHSFEVNFGYVEAGARKQALVKLRVCPKHALQLNYRREKELQKRRREEKRKEKAQKRQKKKKRHKRARKAGSDSGSSKSSSDSDSEESQDEEERTGATCEDASERSHAQLGDGEGDSRHGSDAPGAAPSEADQSGSRDIPGEHGHNTWAQQQPQAEPTRDEEFDQYFQDLLM